MYSLKKILTRNLIINMILVMLGLLVILYFSMQQVLTNYITTRLQHDTESLVSALERSQDGRWQLNPVQMSAVYDQVRSGHYYLVQAGEQTIVSRSVFDIEFPRLAIDASRSSYTTDGPGTETWLIWHQRFNKQGSEIAIWVAEDITPFERHMVLYTGYALLLILGVTGLLIFLQQRTLVRSFQVFEQLRSNMEQIRHLQVENSKINPPSEIMPLIDEIERLVHQLRSRIERTRHSISNLAHELKRPIQLLTIQQEQHAQLTEPLNQIRSIVDRELRRARISGSASSSVDFNPVDEIKDLAAIMNNIYPQVSIDIMPGSMEHSVKLDRDDMLELIGNVLDNSCKYARTSVTVRVDIDDEYVTMIFEDDGDGLEQSQIERISQRGVRLDESRDGHGIGLGLCQDIVNSYQGGMEFSRAEPGGLRVMIRIPLLLQ